MRLVKNYPHYKIVNFDKLDYCASLVNIEEIASYPNYVFVKVWQVFPSVGAVLASPAHARPCSCSA
jgi:dTDP-D-glucose 4,6-dehydratase